MNINFNDLKKKFDFKLEAIIIILCVISLFLAHNFLDDFTLNSYFSDERQSNIREFFSISIGIYVAVITILGTTMIAITKNILEKKIDKKLINFIVIGIIEALLTIIMSTYIESKWFKYYYEILLILNIVTLITFSKFIYILTLLFQKNLDSLAEKIDEETVETEEIKEHRRIVSDILKILEKKYKS